jgi:DNA adenine methylase
MNKPVRFIRYPGGKQRLLNQILPVLPSKNDIKGKYVEPFVGGGAVYFSISPRKALLSDINPVLIQLFKSLKEKPLLVWKYFKEFLSTKKAYYAIRDGKIRDSEAYKAARMLYLNRTCFKGMWRENAAGKFNVGYGGQDRRWVISRKSLIEVSNYLKTADLKVSDFEKTIEKCKKHDFIFLDPPYKPGAKELKHSHYVHSRFSFNDYKRLAIVLKDATKRGVKWAMTTSSHKHILELFDNTTIKHFRKGTGSRPGILKKNPGEVLIYNYQGGSL